MLLQTLHVTSYSEGKACRRVLSAPLVPGTGLLLEGGREGGRQCGRKARLQGEDRLCVLFPVTCVFLFPWHSLSHYKVLPKGISANFFPKCLGTHQAPAGLLLFTELLRSLDTYPLFPATKFSTFSASENVFVENPPYQPWWDKPSWEPKWGCLPSKGTSRHLTWMFIDLQQCFKTCENSILQFYWDIWKVHSQRLPLLAEIQMPKGVCQKISICTLLSFNKTFLFRLVGIYRLKVQNETSDINFSTFWI